MIVRSLITSVSELTLCRYWSVYAWLAEPDGIVVVPSPARASDSSSGVPS